MSRPIGLGRRTALALLLAEACHAGEPVWCHEVRRGDTLTTIARRHGASVSDLRGLNRLGPNATGGCNPGYLPHQQNGTNISISATDLKDGAKYF